MSTESLTAVIRTLALPDEEYFSLDDAATLAIQTRVVRLLQTPPKPGPREPLPELRAIGAPQRADWSRRATLPLLLAEVRSNQHAWEVHPTQNRTLVLSNLDTGEVDVIAPMDKGRRMPVLQPSRSGPPPDGFNAGLSSIGVRRYNLLDWFAKGILEGHLAATFLEYDLLSNTVVIDASGPETAKKAGQSLRGPGRIAVQAATVRGGASGAALRVPATIANAPAPLTAELRLPRARVTAIHAPEGSAQPLILAATLLLLQVDRLKPVRLDLAVPANARNGDIEAAFTIDLHSLLAGRSLSGDWRAYLVAGDSITGPCPVRIE